MNWNVHEHFSSQSNGLKKEAFQSEHGSQFPKELFDVFYAGHKVFSQHRLRQFTR